MTTEQHRTNKVFAYLLIAGLLVVVPVSIWYGKKAHTEQVDVETPLAASLPSLTDSSFGAVRIGMTLGELQAAIGQLGDTTKLKRECDIVSATDPFKMPAGVSITQVNGRVARIDIENDSVATDKGIRVGDTEAKVMQMYGSGVIVEPHKYISGHYLEIKSGTDSATAKGVVFETDGKKVTTFRAGFWDPVRWVEGCA
ncbi:MAG: hypothetical protein M3Z17_04605 [Gemmatimonadota bacterium]|nr:hypothetical protein [Gemmatimonadota bacterium]